MRHVLWSFTCLFFSRGLFPIRPLGRAMEMWPFGDTPFGQPFSSKTKEENRRYLAIYEKTFEKDIYQTP